MTEFVSALLANWRQALVGGTIVICAVIVIMGLIKNLFDKVPYRLLRKFLLAFTSIVLVLPISAIYFVCAGINYKYFLGSYALLSVATIVTYWLYENTCLRELIHKIGSLTIGRFIGFISAKFKGNLDSDDDLKEFTDALQEEVKSEVKSTLPSLLPEEKKEEKIRIPISTSNKIAVAPNRSLEKEANELKIL